MKPFLFLCWLMAATSAFAQDVGRVHFLQGESDVDRGSYQAV